MKSITIGNRHIGAGEPVFVIAEAGVNHNGDIALAKKLIDVAKESGADAVKFQTFTPAELVTKDAPQASYQIVNTGRKESQFEMLEKLALTHDDFAELKTYTEHAGLMFMSTPFSAHDADFLDSIGMQVIKIPSGELTNLPYLAHLASKKKPLILSTGMAVLDEVREAVETLKRSGTEDIVLLQCTTEYPAKPAHVNLRAMTTMQQTFGFPVGFSDHTEGIAAATAAVALGACIIEKHFTLDQTLPGPDHKASSEPAELREMIRYIRLVEAFLGSGEKIPSDEESENAKIVRKSIVATTDIQVGETFSENNLALKRPGTGLPPRQWDPTLGKRATRIISSGSLLSADDIAP